MSDLWVTVTAGYGNTTFAHRSTSPYAQVALNEVVHTFNVELDNAASIVRDGICGWAPPQSEFLVRVHHKSDHEKIIAIQRIFDDESIGYEGALGAIGKILDS